MQVVCKCPGCGNEFQVTTSAPKQAAPKQGTLTGKVWEIATGLSVDGKRAPRKAVIEAGLAAGLNIATITTQYQRWSKQWQLDHPEQAVAAEPAPAQA